MDTSRAADLLRGAVEHTWTVVADTAAGEIPLDVISGELVLDEHWSPYAQQSILCRVPDDQDTLDALDPRAGARLVTTLGYVYPDGTSDVETVSNLALTSRIVARPADTMELIAHSQEMRLQDAVALVDTVPTLSGAWECLSGIITTATAPTSPTIVSDLPLGYGADALTGLEVKAGAQWWDVAADVADRTGVWVHDDGLGTWRIRPRASLAANSAATLTVGPGGTITASEAALTREEWANVVLVRHEWDDETLGPQVASDYAEVTSGPFAVATVGRKTLVVERSTPATAAQAYLAALALVQRTISRGRMLQVDAHAAYWLRPGHTVTVQLPLGPQERHLVSRVAFNIPTGLMSVRTRAPESATITGSA